MFLFDGWQFDGWQFDRWIVGRIGSDGFRGCRTPGSIPAPESKLYEEFGWVNLIFVLS